MPASQLMKLKVPMTLWHIGWLSHWLGTYSVLKCTFIKMLILLSFFHQITSTLKITIRFDEKLTDENRHKRNAKHYLGQKCYCIPNVLLPFKRTISRFRRAEYNKTNRLQKLVTLKLLLKFELRLLLKLAQFWASYTAMTNWRIMNDELHHQRHITLSTTNYTINCTF